MAITQQVQIYFPTVIEPYDARCEDCDRIFRNTKEEFCPRCEGILVDLRRLDPERIAA